MNKTEISLAVIIPCFNEEITISKVIDDFKKELPKASIIVCDNNSTDNTYAIAEANGAKLLKEPKQGKANAVLRLFEKVDADIYIMVDGDDTYPSSQANKLIDALIKNDLDMVVGDRLSNKSYYKENTRAFHSFGNRLMKTLINNFFKSNNKDILSGYRILSRRFVKNYITLAHGFELETDLTIFCLNYNLPMGEIPIQYRDRPKNSFSKLNTYKDGIKVLKTIIDLYRLYKPLNFFLGLSLFVLIVAIPIGLPPIYEYIKFQYIYKVPSFILSAIMVLTSLLFLTTGLILDNIMKIDRKSVILKIKQYK